MNALSCEQSSGIRFPYQMMKFSADCHLMSAQVARTIVCLLNHERGSLHYTFPNSDRLFPAFI